MKKRLLCLAFILLAVSLAGIPGHASRGPADTWQTAYAQVLRQDIANFPLAFGEARKYAFTDLNQDGAPELFAYTWSAEGTRDHKLYACVDGQLQAFAGNPRPASAYRYTKTGELLWIYRDDQGTTEFTFNFKSWRCKESRIFEYRPEEDDGRGVWRIDGEEVSKSKYDREYEKWEDAHELVMKPIDIDALLPDAEARQAFMETGELDIASLREKMQIPEAEEQGTTARNILLWGGIALGVFVLVAAAIFLLLAMRKRKKMRQKHWWNEV